VGVGERGIWGDNKEKSVAGGMRMVGGEGGRGEEGGG